MTVIAMNDIASRKVVIYAFTFFYVEPECSSNCHGTYTVSFLSNLPARLAVLMSLC